MTSLMGAYCNGYLEVVKLLLEQNGIDINALTNEGKTAIILAAQRNIDIKSSKCLKSMKELLMMSNL